MQSQKLINFAFGVNAVGATLFAAFAQLAASPALAGEREDALALCRAAIAEAYQVAADESGAHFRESATTARAYTMRFEVPAREGAAPLVTCKVKRGALVVAGITPEAPAAGERAVLQDAAGPAAPATQ